MKCLICGNEYKAITAIHLKAKHQLTSEMYLSLYHDAVLYPPEVRSKIAAKHIGKKCTPRPPVSTETRAKISSSHAGKKLGPSSEEKKAKQRASWAENYDARCKSIQNSYTPERLEKARVSQQRVIAERGYHLARGRETRLERLVREYYEARGYSVKKQKQSVSLVLGVKRYYDVFVQELNLLIEADGEYWHTRADRLRIDEAKEAAALADGFNFIRISDALLKRGHETEQLSILLESTSEEARAISSSLLAARRAKIAARQAQA